MMFKCKFFFTETILIIPLPAIGHQLDVPYTVKKVNDIPVPSRDVTNKDSPWRWII